QSTNGRTFRWSLDKVIDPRGNYYLIDYMQDTYPVGGLSYVAEIYPLKAQYTYNDTVGAPAIKRRMVTFVYEDRGASFSERDQPTSFRAGFKVQVRKRLKEVDVGIDWNGDSTLASSEFTKSYDLTYKTKMGPDSVYPGVTVTKVPFSELDSIRSN